MQFGAFLTIQNFSFTFYLLVNSGSVILYFVIYVCVYIYIETALCSTGG